MSDNPGRKNPAQPGLTVWTPHPDAPPGYADTRPPNKYTREMHDRIVGLIYKGITPENAARACGITAKTFAEWIRKGQEGDYWLRDFAADCDQAMAIGHIKIEEVLVQKANDDPEFALKYLERRDSKHWNKDTRTIVERTFTELFGRLKERLPPHIYEQVILAASEHTAGHQQRAFESSEDEEG